MELVRNDDAEPLVIDRSPPDRLSDAELRAWAADQRVFVSSVMATMSKERAAVTAAIEQFGATPIVFERLGGRDDTAQLAYRDGVRGSDVYVGILGERYGIPDSTGYSPTHQEYNEAVHQGLRISVWNTTGDMDGRQRDFLAEVQVFHTTGSYSSPDDLATKLTTRLRELAESAGSPWCKVGRAMFRARRVSDDGSRIVVEADLRDAAVVAAIEELRPGQWSHSRTVRVSWARGTRLIAVDNVLIEATAGRARHVHIEGSVAEASKGGSDLHDMSFNGKSPEELGELAVRIALLGEPNPLGTMSFLVDMPNPLAALADLGLSEDTVPAVSEVLLVEELVGSGRADRLTTFRLGPERNGQRRLLLEWLPRRRYSNVQPEGRSLEGEVRI